MPDQRRPLACKLGPFWGEHGSTAPCAALLPPQSRASSGRRRLPYTGSSAITVAVPLSAEEAEGEGGSSAVVPVKASEWRPGPREPGASASRETAMMWGLGQVDGCISRC